MTTMDKVNAMVTSTISMVFDKEPLNYLEAAGLFSIVAAGRQNISSLEILYNHAKDAELKAIIKDAIDDQSRRLVEWSENFLQEGDVGLPTFHFVRRRLHESGLSVPDDGRFTDQEILLALANMAKVSQLAVLSAMHQTYQPQIASIYRQTLESAFDFNFRLLQLALDKGWLPHLPKIEH
jgi:hypothetical protein